MAHQKTAIIIAGPTAVGKTLFAIETAKLFNTEIISADSRQCYKELNIGVARPSPAELAAVPHHFIASHSIHDHVTAATFVDYALSKLEDLFSRSDHAVITGGTGLYLKALTYGLDNIPPADHALREEIQNEYQIKGLEWLRSEVQMHDPVFFEKGENQNPHRLMRALVVVKSTGKSILDYHEGKKQERNFSIVKIAMDLPREELYARINKRTIHMMEHGLVQEAKELVQYRHLKALQTVGYAELFEHFDGKMSIEKATDEIQKNTRHYAKRQLTWFRKQDYQWIDAANASSEKIQALIP